MNGDLISCQNLIDHKDLVEKNVMDVLISGICIGHGISKIATKDEDFRIIAKVEYLEIMDSAWSRPHLW